MAWPASEESCCSRDLISTLDQEQTRVARTDAGGSNGRGHPRHGLKLLRGKPAYESSSGMIPYSTMDEPRVDFSLIRGERRSFELARIKLMGSRIEAGVC